MGKNKLMQTVANKFTSDTAERSGLGSDEFFAILRARDENSVWFTDEDEVKLNELKVIPVYGGMFVDSTLEKINKSGYAKYASSKEACEQAGYDATIAPEATGQLVQIKSAEGTYVYPLGNSAVKGLSDRAMIKVECYESLKKFTPASLSMVLNECFKAGGGKAVSILVQDGKVRAMNSGRYAICPTLFVAEELKSWVDKTYPKAELINGYYSHEFVRWVYDFSDYTNQILGKYPVLTKRGYTPALIAMVSNIGTSSVMFRPALKSGNTYFAIGEALSTYHVASGTASVRTDAIKKAVQKNIESIFVSMDKAFDGVQKMETISVKNALNALLRGMKTVGMPKAQALEAAELFEASFGNGPATAYDCLLSVIDAYSFVVREFPNSEKKMLDASDAVARATKLNWRELGNIPGSFSW